MANTTTPMGDLDYSKVKRRTAINGHYARRFSVEIANLRIAFQNWICNKEYNRRHPETHDFRIAIIESKFQIISATGRLKKAFKWMLFAGIQIKRT